MSDERYTSEQTRMASDIVRPVVLWFLLDAIDVNVVEFELTLCTHVYVGARQCMYYAI